ncbi:MAG: TetR/AcrR family transcriptional regulator [Solirubrobacteraceae bacterium]|nr:TetR/AcrR family transcriptional regulator [Solirubrobacteraceae bacterium]
MIDESVTPAARTDEVAARPVSDAAPGAGNDGAAPQAPGPREQQRQRTRRAILDETVRCLVDDGYGALTTRRIAERAGIAQSTLMHHFETREGLLVEAVATLAEQVASASIREVQAIGARGAAQREAVLDQAWATFTSPEALAAAQLWGAAWAEPEVATALRDLEVRVGQLILGAAQEVLPDETTDPRFAIYIDGVYQLIRGLVMGIPVWGKDVIDARWALIKPVLLEASLEVVPVDG